MELPVYTSLFRLERRIHVIGEVQLPQPVTLMEAAAFVTTLGALVLLSRVLHLDLPPSVWWLYVVLPWLGARAATQPLADRKRVDLWLLSQLRYALAEPRLLGRLRPLREPAEARISAEVWQPRPRPAWRAVREADPLVGRAGFRLEVIPPVSGSGRPGHAGRHQPRGQSALWGRRQPRPWSVRRLLFVGAVGLLSFAALGWWTWAFFQQTAAALWGGGR